jgi:plasmid stabilization system protein ParE
MSSYRTRPRAEQDLIEYFAYIARDKLPPADRFLVIAEQCFERIAAMPGMGRKWESRHPKLQNIRVFPMPGKYRSYLIFYRVASDKTVEILTVLHGARDIGTLLEEIID